MSDKDKDTERHGGPGASHENRKEADMSKPHGRLDTIPTGGSKS